jgi:hypothetical protein
MMVVCQKCRSSNQFGTLFCRNCGEKLKIVDQNHPDFNTGRAIKKIIARIINWAVILSLIGLVGALFVPFGLPSEKEVTAEDIKKAKEDCEAIDSALRTGKGSVIFNFTPERASWGLNYLLDEKRPMPPMPPVASSSNYASPSVSTPPSGITPRAPLQSRSKGPMKLSSGSDAKISGPGKFGNVTFVTTSDPNTVKISASERNALMSPFMSSQTSQPKMAQTLEATPEAGVWKGHTTPTARKSEAPVKEEPMFTAKYAVEINKNCDASVILSGKMLYYIPYRLELIGELKDSEPDKNGDTRPEFELKSTKFGHVTLPPFLKKQGLELFKLMMTDQKIKAYAGRIKAIKVESEDAIQVTVSR